MSGATGVGGPPDGSGIVLRDDFVRRDQGSEPVYLCLGNNHAVKCVARPLLVERRLCHFSKGQLAEAQVQFVCHFAQNVLCRQNETPDLVQVFELQEHHRRNQQLGPTNQPGSVRSNGLGAAMSKAQNGVRVEVGDHALRRVFRALDRAGADAVCTGFASCANWWSHLRSQSRIMSAFHASSARSAPGRTISIGVIRLSLSVRSPRERSARGVPCGVPRSLCLRELDRPA